MNQKNKSNLIPIIMMFALFAMISFVTGLSNPMGVIVKNQPGVANWMSQLGNFANFLAYLFMGIPAGVILKKRGYKFSALAAIAVGFVGVGIQLISGLIPYTPGESNFTPIFLVYLLGAFVSGFSMCMLNTVVCPLLNTLGGGDKGGNQLMQFAGSLNSLSATIVPILGGYLIGNIASASLSNAIPALLIAMAIFAFTFIVLSFVSIPEPHMESADKAKVKETHSALSFRHFILGAIAVFVYVGVEVGIPNFINLFLTDTNGLAFSAGVAGSVVGTYWLLMMVGRFAGGLLASVVSPKAMLAGVSSIAAALVVVGIFASTDIRVNMPVFGSGNAATEEVAECCDEKPAECSDEKPAECEKVAECCDEPAAAAVGAEEEEEIAASTGFSFGFTEVPLSVLLFALCGLCTSVMWGSVFNLATEGLGKYTAMGSGFFMVMVVGGGVLPLLQGVVADVSNYMTSYWVIVAACLYMVYYALIGSRNVNKDIPVE